MGAAKPPCIQFVVPQRDPKREAVDQPDPAKCAECQRTELDHRDQLLRISQCTQFKRSFQYGDEETPMPELVCAVCGGPFRLHDNPWDKPAGCRQCTLFREPGPVMSGGPVDAKLAAFAEAPGAHEVDAERGYGKMKSVGAFDRSRWGTLIGGSGRVFSSMCYQAGIERPKIRLGNVVKCRPPKNRPPSPLEVRMCANVFLSKELDEINPNVLVGLGETAFSTVTGLKGITNHRGVPVEGYKRKDGTRQKVFGTWHPAFIIRSQHLWPFALHDLVRAAAQAEFPEIRRVPFNIVVGERTDAARADVLARVREKRRATFDFETTGLSPKHHQIAMVGITEDGTTAEVLDWTQRNAKLFQEILDDDSITLIGQNILYFDLPFAEGRGHNIDKAWKRVLDDMVIFHLCNASYGNSPVKDAESGGRGRQRAPEKDLTMIASCHTDIPYWKSKENYKGDLRRVCGTDVIATHRAMMDPESGLLHELKSYGMESLYFDHVLPVHPVLHKMNVRGVKCDVPKAMKWGLAYYKEARRLEDELRVSLGKPDFNFKSSVQLIKLLYDELKLPVQTKKDPKTGEMRRTADAIALQTLGAMDLGNKHLEGIIEIRHCEKMKSTYIDDGVKQGRYHPHIGTSKTANGRLNSWDPNGQNVPPDLRELWVADSEDEFLLISDWSQIEWRVAMALSGDPVGLDLLARGVDTHNAVYAEAFSKPISEVTGQEREAAKFIVYGLSYGRTPQSIADATAGKGTNIGSAARQHAMRAKAVKGEALSLGFVENFVERFKQRFKVYWRYREETIAFVRQHNYLVNPWGRRRWWYTNEVTEQYAFQPASTGAEMMIDALITLDSQLPPGCTLRLTVHDEVMMNGPKSAAREAIKCMRQVMQSTYPKIDDASVDRATLRRFYPNGWYCPVDIHAAPNWYLAKTKNPEHKKLRAAFEASIGVTDLVGEGK